MDSADRERIVSVLSALADAGLDVKCPTCSTCAMWHESYPAHGECELNDNDLTNFHDFCSCWLESERRGVRNGEGQD